MGTSASFGPSACAGLSGGAACASNSDGKIRKRPEAKQAVKQELMAESLTPSREKNFPYIRFTSTRTAKLRELSSGGPRVRNSDSRQKIHCAQQTSARKGFIKEVKENS